MLQTDTMFEMLKSEIVCPLMNNPVVWPIFLSCLTAWPDDQLSGYCCIIRHWWSSWFRQHSSCAFIWSHNLIIFFLFMQTDIFFCVLDLSKRFEWSLKHGRGSANEQLSTGLAISEAPSSNPTLTATWICSR